MMEADNVRQYSRIVCEQFWSAANTSHTVMQHLAGDGPQCLILLAQLVS